MKLLLYCCKNKPYINKRGDDITDYPDYVFDCEGINGKIVAECDYELEKIYYSNITEEYSISSLPYISGIEEMYQKMCLDYVELSEYLDNEDESGDCGYAIHIKNLNVFDKPIELSNLYNVNPLTDIRRITNAPQNMRYVQDYLGHKYVLISIRPEWLCKILNGEKTIEVRKKVLKEML